ncbi:MAG: HD domain-containing protein [Solirubrobacterales bacterium]
MRQPPKFVAKSELLSRAYAFAHAAHHGPAREGDTDIAHPLSVAELLHEQGFDDQIVAAALLHDVVEDTAVDLPAIADSFGPEVGALVGEMTEDAGIGSYRERKAEHRSRVVRDPRAAAIYAADKLAKARRLEKPGELPPDKLDHYRKTLELLRDRHPELPFLSQLRIELDRAAEQP